MKYLLLLFLIPLNSHAIFQYIYQGYKNSDRYEALTTDRDMKRENYNYQVNKYDWSLDLGAQYSDSNLLSLYSFQSQQTIANTTYLTLKKQTFHYGEFSLTHSRTTSDISNWSASSLNSFSSDKVYEAKNNFSYSFDVLNKPLALEFEGIEHQKDADELTANIEIQKDALDFFNMYLDTKLMVVTNRHYSEFEKRAKKRVALVKKRVRDGLSKKVELNQSKISLITQQETINKNLVTLKENVFKLENVIGEKVPEKRYMGIKWPFKSSKAFPMIHEKKQYTEVDRLKVLNELNMVNIRKLDLESSHSLKLKLSYTKNSVNELESDALADSFASGNNDEKVASIVYSIPFGQGKAGTARTQYLYQQRKNEIALKNMEDDYAVQEKSIKYGLEQYERTISLARRKVKTSYQSINETQRLYLRGQASFEDLLRAEESYINSKINLSNLISVYEKLMAQLAYLNGQMDEFLTSYKD